MVKSITFGLSNQRTTNITSAQMVWHSFQTKMYIACLFVYLCYNLLISVHFIMNNIQIKEYQHQAFAIIAFRMYGQSNPG